jgi:plastocyanin
MSNARALRIFLLLALAGCGGGYSTNPPPPPPPAPPPPPPPGPGNPGPTADVAMNSSDDGYGGNAVNAFVPGSVTITRTGTVTWSNPTGLLHNVTFAAATGAPASIPSFGAGSNTRTFNTAGTFAYQCTNHGGMSGQVVVQ